MPRALVPCLTIVAAFQLHVAAAAPLYEDVPVPSRLADAARAIGLDPAHDSAVFLSELVRVMHAPSTGQPSLTALEEALSGLPAVAGAGDPLVPVPLTAAIWSEAIFGRRVEAPQLFWAIAADRKAALLAYGLTGLDETTLAYFAERPALLAALYRENASAFAAFGESLRIHDGRIVLPVAGSDAQWTAVVGQPPDRPESFVRALFGQQRGRLAYLFDLIANLEPGEAAFATGSWMSDPGLRTARFAALAAIAVGAYGEWNVDAQPFVRPLHDLAFLFMRVRVDDRGAPAGPSSRAFWAAAFADGPAQALPQADGTDGAIDAAWLAAWAAPSNPRARGERLDQLAFGQRVFGGIGPADFPDALEAVRAFRSHRALLLALERMGVVAPRVYGDVVRGVSRVTDRDPNRVFWQMAQLQGALAVITRLSAVGTIGREQAERLVMSLAAVPAQSGGQYGGRVASWIERELLPMLPPSPRSEGRIIAGLAGPRDPGAPTVDWEGQQYRLDFSTAELERLRGVRERQGSYTVDLALAIQRVVRSLAAGSTAADAKTASGALSTAALEFARELGRAMPDILAPGVRAPADARTVMASSARELAALAASNGRGSVRRVVENLTQLVDTVLAEALISIAYAIDIGDPGGTALLGRNVAMRHDFGLSNADTSMRARLPWALPRQDFRPGIPWRVTGSLVGLDIALAQLALRRLSSDRPPEAPSLSSVEREAFAVSVALLDPRRLSDADRRRIAAAIERGRARVASLSADRNADDVERVAAEIGMNERRRHLLRRTLMDDSPSVEALFSLVELLALGGGAPEADLDAWGMGALATSSCPCTRLVRAERWRLLEGRPQVGLMAGALSDLNLHMAVTLDALQVPAPLTKPVLAAAVQEFIEQADPIHMNDWRGLFRAAQSVPRERVEDYVAAAAAVGGPLVPIDAEARLQP